MWVLKDFFFYIILNDFSLHPYTQYNPKCGNKENSTHRLSRLISPEDSEAKSRLHSAKVNIQLLVIRTWHRGDPTEWWVLPPPNPRGTEHAEDGLILWAWLMRVPLESVKSTEDKKKKYGNKKVGIPKLGSLWISTDQPRALLGYCHRQKEHTNFLSEKKNQCFRNSSSSWKDWDCPQEDWLSLWRCYPD